MAGIYIHIPFCRSRCVYCGFYSTTLPQLIPEYVEAVCREAVLRAGYISGAADTVYLGGGTPSLLPQKELERLFLYINNVYGIKTDAEVTIECNPDDVTPEFAAMLRHVPVNRVSMGAQTFSDSRLRFLRRRHCAEDVERAVSLLRGVGIGNISIDLMFGFPGETIDEWGRDVSSALALGVEHLSAYSLMYEEGTPLRRMLERGSVTEIDEETSRAMYELLIDRLAAAGFEHYEISNFARPGFRSRHNSSYWQQKPYLGLGAAAHSYDLTSRQWNVDDVSRYMADISRGVVPCGKETLDKPTRYDDLITTALRTADGLDLDMLTRDFGSEYREYCLAQAGRYISSGQLCVTPDSHLRLTRSGLYVSDMIMSDMMKV